MLTLTVTTTHRIKEFYEEGKLVLRQQGFFSFLKYMMAFFIRVLFVCGSCYIYENRLDGPIITPRLDNLTLKLISTSEEFQQLLADDFDFSSLTDIPLAIKRLNRGAKAFYAFVGKEFAHVTWATTSRKAKGDFHPYPIEGEDTACVGATITAPQYRRKGINVYVHSQVFRCLKEEGLSRAFISINKDNIAAQNSQKKLGSVRWGNGYYVRLLYLFNYMWTKSRMNR
jgi:GNAT superfamily N-acetyltransferase